MTISTGQVATASDVLKLAPLAKVQNFTRLLDAATASVDYTGFGFEPKAITIYATETAYNVSSWGMYASAQNCEDYAASSGIITFRAGKIIRIMPMGMGQTASVGATASDGFTLAWALASGHGAVGFNFTVLAIGDGQ